MKNRASPILLLMLGVMLWPTARAVADEPMEVLKQYVDRGISILKEPRYQPEEMKAVQRDAFWEEVREVFDFTEVSRRALARNWRDFKPDQQAEFTEVFSRLLGNTYVEKIQKEFQKEEVVYLGQTMEKEGRAMVRTEIVRADMKIPIDYKLHLSDGRWRVYDVFVEGVSLVKNYRTQFSEFLAKENPEALIRRLKEKVGQQAAADDNGRPHRLELG